MLKQVESKNSEKLGSVLQHTTQSITGFPLSEHFSSKLLLEYLREWKLTVAWHSEWYKVLKSFYLFFVKCKLITKTYMIQNKLQSFFLNWKSLHDLLCTNKTIACTAVHNSYCACTLFQPVYVFCQIKYPDNIYQFKNI